MNAAASSWWTRTNRIRSWWRRSAFDDPVDAVAGQPEDGVDAPVDQPLDQQLRRDHSHQLNSAPWFRPAWPTLDLVSVVVPAVASPAEPSGGSPTAMCENFVMSVPSCETRSHSTVGLPHTLVFMQRLATCKVPGPRRYEKLC